MCIFFLYSRKKNHQISELYINSILLERTRIIVEYNILEKRYISETCMHRNLKDI